MSVLKRLTENIVDRDLTKEGAALRNKWEKTGLLEGLKDDSQKNGMAVLLENQAKQLLKESSAMSAGDVEGFAAVAFPIVRRVFGSLIANELVSVQPMSLPSGLIFFLDFQVSGSRLGAVGEPDVARANRDSVFGGGRVGSQITGGVDLTGANLEKSFYSLNNGYSSATGSVTASLVTASVVAGGGVVGSSAALDKVLRFDPDLADPDEVAVVVVSVASLEAGNAPLNKSDLVAVKVTTQVSGTQVRRLTAKCDATGADAVGDSYTHLRLVFKCDDPALVDAAALATQLTTGTKGVTFPADDNLERGGGLGSIRGTAQWALEGKEQIPEIDVKIDSVSVSAKTKKLKVKWTPELGQDLNAYHNLDAEVELTSIMSEHIALEIDQEVLEDLVKGATAGVYYWSRRPGRFLNKATGVAIGGGDPNEQLLGADFTGNVSMWYETLLETVNDLSAQIHRKTLRGGANFIVTSPEVASILEMTAGFRASGVVPDEAKGTAGAVKVGSLSKKWDVMVDPYFPRNLLLVGRRGTQFLESGYVYAPYVPLQVTPTIFGTEDFVPRKGVMTRYAKKMVRPDMFGLVVVQDLLG
jgi:hypothetical protein